MGVCRQIKDEIFRCPPVLLLIGRPQDAWLATWSRADAAVTLPVDPVEFADALAALLRRKGLAAERLSGTGGAGAVGVARGATPVGSDRRGPQSAVSLSAVLLAAVQRAALAPVLPRPGSSRRSRCRTASIVVAVAVDDLDDVALADGVEEPLGVARCSCRCSRG